MIMPVIVPKDNEKSEITPILVTRGWTTVDRLWMIGEEGSDLTFNHQSSIINNQSRRPLR
jgi:hypothetical protein